MFVKPGTMPDGQPKLVRHPGRGGRHMRPEGEEVPETTDWHRRLNQGDVVPAEPPVALVEEPPLPVDQPVHTPGEEPAPLAEREIAP
jgi:hypothetical protein